MSARASARFVAVAFVVLVTTPAALGQTMAEKYPPNEGELRPTMGWAPQFQREINRPERDRVHLNVDWADNELDQSPVTFGVPFPDGALSSVDHARLVTADGTVVPAQIDALATWWRKDGPVRWALVNATVRKGEQYFIEYGTAVRAEKPEGIEVQDTDAGIVINTGPMQATVSKQRATLLDLCALDVNGDGQFAADELIITPELAAANLPVVVDAEGNRYPAGGVVAVGSDRKRSQGGADEDLKMAVVERGPMRTVVRREGWYVSDDGTRFCQFITYTYFYAGQAGMKHDHTLVVAFDSKEHQIRDVQIAVPVKVAAGWYGAFALEEPDEHLWREAGMAAGPMRLIQDRQDHWSLTQDGSEQASGEHANGCFGLYDLRWGAHAAVRDFWEQYPSELEVADGALRLHLWPAHGTEVLNFQPSAWMGDEYPGDRVFWQDFYRGGLDSWVQAYGVGKTHNIYVNFWAFDDRARAASLTSAFDQPVLVYADPAWNCATEAFGRVHPGDREHFSELEAIIDALVYRKQWLRERLGNYGWISFGDVNYNLANSTDPENITYGHWRHWAQMFYGGPNVMPLLYLRSGRRDAWDFHRSNAKHITDFDICHLDSEEFSKIKGGRYGGNGGICHYAANIYSLGCDCHLRFMLYDYYLNGNLRTWEVANEFIQRYHKDRERYTTYQHRMTGGALRFFSEAYEAAWKPEYLSCMRQFADILYGAQGELGFTRYDDVYMNVGKIRYYQLTGDERMRELFLNDMTVLTRRRDANVFADCRHTTLLGLAHAYWFTGDEKYLPYAAWQLEVARSRIPTTGEPHEIGAAPWTFEHAYNSTLGNQLPVFLALLAETKELPPAAGPTGSGNWAIYFHEAQDQEFRVRVGVKLYRSVPGLSAAPFRNWEQWVERLPEDARPHLAMIAPDGSEVARVDPLGGAQQEAELAADTGATREVAQFTVPADGQTGTYAVVPTTLVAPIMLQVMESTLPQRVLPTGDSWTHTTTQHFLVPAGTGNFSVAVKAIELRSQPRVVIRNAAAEEVARATWEVGSDCRHDWEVFELDAGRPARDEAWSINLLEPVALFLRFEGVPGHVASGPGDLFVPGQEVELPAVEQVRDAEEVSYVASRLPWAGKAAALPSGVGVKISSPDGEQPLLNETEGTVEMWVKDTRQYTDLRNRGLIRCGGLNLYRRICVGTYLYIAGAGHQTGFVLPQGRWCHLAATWKPSPKGGTEVAIYADGVRVETTYNRHINPEPGWAGSDLMIPAAGSGLFVDELRASDIARYDGNFELPAGPFEPDEHTRVLCHFDGDGQALALGETVPLTKP